MKKSDGGTSLLRPGPTKVGPYAIFLQAVKACPRAEQARPLQPNELQGQVFSGLRVRLDLQAPAEEPVKKSLLMYISSAQLRPDENRRQVPTVDFESARSTI